MDWTEKVILFSLGNSVWKRRNISLGVSKGSVLGHPRKVSDAPDERETSAFRGRISESSRRQRHTDYYWCGFSPLESTDRGDGTEGRCWMSPDCLLFLNYGLLPLSCETFSVFDCVYVITLTAGKGEGDSSRRRFEHI